MHRCEDFTMTAQTKVMSTSSASSRQRWLESVCVVMTVGFSQRFCLPALAANLPAPSTQAPFLFECPRSVCASFGTIYFVPFREFTAQKLQ